MSVAVGGLRSLLAVASDSSVELPEHVLNGHTAVAFARPGLRLTDAVVDADGHGVSGSAVTTLARSPVPVRVVFSGVDGQVTGAIATADLAGVLHSDSTLVVVDGSPRGSRLGPGAWLVLPDRTLPLTSALGTGSPWAFAERPRGPRAVVTRRGIVVTRPGPVRRRGVRVLESPWERGWSDITPPTGDQGVSIDYESPPLRVAGALTVLPARDPYLTVLGGVLLVDTGGINGAAMGSYVVPKSGTAPSFFGFGVLGNAAGFGPPVFQVRALAAGFGWIAAGLAFDCFETIRGSALALVQTGSDLTISLLGIGGAELPRQGSTKLARIEIAIEATLRPKAGELRFGAGLTSNSYVLDPNCRLRGGVSFTAWFGPHRNAGGGRTAWSTSRYRGACGESRPRVGCPDRTSR